MSFAANVIPISDDLAIYENRIFQLADEYAESLVNAYQTEEQVIDRLNTFKGFRGLINYIYVHLFKPTASNPKRRTDQYASMVNSVLDYNDIDLLDYIFDVYVSLCSRYNQIPSVLNYCTMVGISYPTVKSWLNGSVRDYDPIGDPDNIDSLSSGSYNYHNNNIYNNIDYNFSVSKRKHKEVVRRWLDISEGSMYDNAAAGNIGGIFLMKSVFGYRETTPVQVEETAGKPRLSKSEILALTGDSVDNGPVPDF